MPDDALNTLTTAQQGSVIPTAKTFLTYVDVDRIVGEAGVPSKKFVESVRTHNILQPILVVGSPNDDEPIFTLVDGRRRLSAAKIVGIKRIPAYIREAQDEAVAALTVIANLHRSRDVASELRAVRQLVTQGYTEDDLQALLGLYQRDFKKLQRLMGLCPSAIEVLESGRMSASTAAVVATLPQSTQLELVALAGEGKITLDAAKAYRKKHLLQPSQLTFLTTVLPTVEVGA